MTRQRPTDEVILRLLRSMERAMPPDDAITAVALDLQLPTETVREVALQDMLGRS